MNPLEPLAPFGGVDLIESDLIPYDPPLICGWIWAGRDRVYINPRALEELLTRLGETDCLTIIRRIDPPAGEEAPP
jgi:hypothetical protein